MGFMTSTELLVERHISRVRFFTEQEAWSYFRLAAFGEAIGWTLLITGLAIKRFAVHGNNDPVVVAGQLHGTLFLIYVTVVIVTAGSLRWRPRRIIVAALASIPPYGTLVFEKWAAHRRRARLAKTYRQVVVRALIISKNELLALEPADSSFWCLPGGPLKSHETAAQALTRLVTAQTGVVPKPGRLAAVLEYHGRNQNRLELFFEVKNSASFRSTGGQLPASLKPDFERLGFVAHKRADLQPVFLQNPAVFMRLSQTEGPAEFFTDQPAVPSN
jgi:integral membrane protein